MTRVEHEARVAERRAALRRELAGILEDRRNCTLELGCGHGHYLTAYAAAHPQEFCLGVDLKGDRLRRAQAKSRRAGLGNLAWLRGAAEEVLGEWPSGVVPSRVLLLFPDPWPKARHHKHRLVQTVLLDRLAELVPSGGALHFRTDDAGYFAWTRDLLGRSQTWREDPDAPWPFEAATIFQGYAQGYQSLTAVRR